MPEGLPARRADGGRSLFQRLVHRLEDRHQHAEGEREGDEDVGEDDGVRREHQLMVFRDVLPDHAVLAPQQEVCEARDRRRDGGPQELVTTDSFSAKMASGAVRAPQKLRSPLLVPKMKIDASGRSTSGSINRMTITS